MEKIFQEPLMEKKESFMEKKEKKSQEAFLEKKFHRKIKFMTQLVMFKDERFQGKSLGNFQEKTQLMSKDTDSSSLTKPERSLKEIDLEPEAFKEEPEAFKEEPEAFKKEKIRLITTDFKSNLESFATKRVKTFRVKAFGIKTFRVDKLRFQTNPRMYQKG
jgi:hypothetical protein